MLRVIYDLAIKYRLDPVSEDDGVLDDASAAPKLKADRKRKKREKSDAPTEIEDASVD